jgi:hypothetical protein
MLVPFEKYGAVKTAAHAELYGRIFEELPSGSSVLEIGIGRGNSMKAFVEARPDLQFCAVDNFAEGQYDHELPEAVSSMMPRIMGKISNLASSIFSLM